MPGMEFHRAGMHFRRLGAPLCSALVCGALLIAGPGARADALSAVQLLRLGGCGGRLPAAPPLAHAGVLDRAAALWASGRSLERATERSGYRAQSTAGVRVRGRESALLELLRQRSCALIMRGALREIGLYRRGDETWIVLAEPYVAPRAALRLAPTRAQGRLTASRAAELVNAVRARGARCGRHEFAPAPPVRLSATLDGVALGHASDMAEHGYFDHEDLHGLTPAERVRAVGYRESLVGENIAYGPATVEEVVQGWLASPGHCQNIMDPRFAEMGLAYAPGQKGRQGLYWVQLLAEPRS